MSELNLIPQSDYIDACNAVREKDGSTGLILSGELGAKIRAIPTGGGDPVIKPIKITQNGTTTAPEGTDGYSPIEVAVPSDMKPEVAGNETIKTNGTKTFNPPNGSVFSSFTAVVETPEPKPEQSYTKTYTSNGSYPITPDTGKVISGGSITVNTPKPKPEETKSVKYTTNGSKTVTPTEGKVMTAVNVEVDVPTPAPVIQSKTITSNGTYTAPSGVDGYSPVTVNCPAPKPEQSKTIEITANGDYPVTPDVGKVLSEVIAKVNVPTGGGGSDLSPFDHAEIETWIPAADTLSYPIADYTNVDTILFYSKGGVFEADLYIIQGEIIVSEENGAAGSDGYISGAVATSATLRGNNFVSKGGIFKKPTEIKCSSNSNFKAGREYWIIKLFGPMKQ